MNQNGRVTTHVPAAEGWRLVEPGWGTINGVHQIYRLAISPMLCWLVDSHEYIDPNADEAESPKINTFVTPVGLDGPPTSYWAIQHPDDSLEIVGDQQFTDAEDLIEYFKLRYEDDMKPVNKKYWPKTNRPLSTQ